MSNQDTDELIKKLEKSGITDKDDWSSGLSFSDRSLKLNSYEDGRIIKNALEKCEELKYFRLNGNTIGVAAAEAIGDGLMTHSELKRAIWDNMFTGRTKEEIPYALKHLSKGVMVAGARLVELQLSDNAIGPIGMAGLTELLKSASCSTLEELKLNNTGLGVGGAKVLSDVLCSAKMGDNGPHIRVLIIGRNRLENEGAIALSKYIKLNKHLEVISMPQNGIFYPGIKALSKAFIENKKLKEINLNDNILGEKGALALSKALKVLADLQVLNIGDCIIKTNGAISIAAAIQSNHDQLQELYFNYNEFKLEGGIALARAMKDKMKMRVLSMKGNLFGRGAEEKILHILSKFGLGNILDEASDDEGSESESVVNEEDEDESRAETETAEESDDEEKHPNEGSEGKSVVNEGEDEEDESRAETETAEESDDEEKHPNEESEVESVVYEGEEDKEIESRTETETDDEETTHDETAKSSNHTLARFLEKPSTQLFKRIGDNPRQVISNYLEHSDETERFKVWLKALLSVSSLHEDDKFQETIVECCTGLYEDVFEYAIKTEKANDFFNDLVTQLRLLKAEDKKSLLKCNTGACLTILKKVLMTDAIAEPYKGMLQFMINTRDARALDVKTSSKDGCC